MDRFEKIIFNEAERSEASEATGGSEASDHENCSTCSEEETRSEDETPTTSDEEFIVSNSEMEEAEQEECVEDQLELLFESFVNLQEEHKEKRNSKSKVVSSGKSAGN